MQCSPFRGRGAIAAIEQAVLAGRDISLVEGGCLLLIGGQGEEATRKMPLEFMKAHYDAIVANMPAGEFRLGPILPRRPVLWRPAGTL